MSKRSIFSMSISALLAGGLAQAFDRRAGATTACRPSLTFKNVDFSEMQPPTLERTWTAVILVDANGCAPGARGRFDVVFTRQKEIGLDEEFTERFAWTAPEVRVQVAFWADEAVEVNRYWIQNVSVCPCAE
jgi:hypothetical protein